MYYEIFDNRDRSGDGTLVYIDEAGNFCVEVSDECGYAGGDWTWDAEELYKLLGDILGKETKL